MLWKHVYLSASNIIDENNSNARGPRNKAAIMCVYLTDSVSVKSLVFKVNCTKGKCNRMVSVLYS